LGGALQIGGQRPQWRLIFCRLGGRRRGLKLVPIMGFKFANEHLSIDEAFERIIKDMHID
jgi:hypothetical protein